MKFRNQFLKYHVMDTAGDGSEGGAAGGAPEGDNKASDDKGSPEPGAPDVEAMKSENAELLKEVMKKKGKIQELEGKLNETLSKFEGVDLEQYQSLLEAQQNAESERQRQEEERLKSEGKFEELIESKRKEHESIIEQMRTQHTDELSKVSTSVEELQATNQALVNQIEELTVGSAFGNSSLIREDLITAFTPARMRALYGAHFESDGTGNVIGYDLPKGTEGRAPIVNSQGSPVPFDDALKTILSKQGDIEAMLRNKVNGSGSGSGESGKRGSDGGTTIGQGLGRIVHALSKDS